MSKPKYSVKLEMHLSAHMHVRRARLGLSLREVDLALGLPQGSMLRIERGEKRLDAGTMRLLANYFNVSADDFFIGAPDSGVSADPSTRSNVPVSEVDEFISAYCAIQNNDARREVLALVRSVASSPYYSHADQAGPDDELRLNIIAS